MPEKEIKENKKFGWKKKVIIIFTIFIVSGCLYYSGKAFLHYSWKTSLRYKNNVACLLENPKCFYTNISKEEFIKEMEDLEIPKEEAIQKLKETKIKWGIICEKYNLDPSKRFKYIGNALQYISEIPD